MIVMDISESSQLVCDIQSYSTVGNEEYFQDFWPYLEQYGYIYFLLLKMMTLFATVNLTI